MYAIGTSKGGGLADKTSQCPFPFDNNDTGFN